jgi:uncharacterized protein YjbI with pentapeptide repeats
LPRLSPLLAVAIVPASAPGVLWAAGEREVARTTVFGGTCAKCILSGRKLGGARFVAATFTGSAMVGTDLRAARFVGGFFAGVDLSRADLSASVVVGTDFQGARFEGTRMRGMILTAGRFDGANFRDADLQGSVLTGGTYADADFKGAKLSGASIAGADLSRTRGLTQSQLDGACGDGGTKPPARLTITPCPGVRIYTQRNGR